jgi:hypothetical protein
MMFSLSRAGPHMLINFYIYIYIYIYIVLLVLHAYKMASSREAHHLHHFIHYMTKRHSGILQRGTTVPCMFIRDPWQVARTLMAVGWPRRQRNIRQNKHVVELYTQASRQSYKYAPFDVVMWYHILQKAYYAISRCSLSKH